MPAQVLRRAQGAAGGEVVLRARDDGHYELIVDGVFAMDTVQTSTERTLATAALARVDGETLRVAVGGLGLGCTVRALLDDERVSAVDVVELEPALVEWLRGGAVPGVDDALRDPRVRVHVGDVLDRLPALPHRPFDCVLLDVDNGPSFLVHGGNARVYERPFLRACLGLLRPGGVLAVWASDPSPALRDLLAAEAASCEELPLPVDREGHRFTYALYLATSP